MDKNHGFCLFAFQIEEVKKVGGRGGVKELGQCKSCCSTDLDTVPDLFLHVYLTAVPAVV